MFQSESYYKSNLLIENKVPDREFVIRCDPCGYFSGYLKEFQCIILTTEAEDMLVKLLKILSTQDSSKSYIKFLILNSRQIFDICNMA